MSNHQKAWEEGMFICQVKSGKRNDAVNKNTTQPVNKNRSTSSPANINAYSAKHNTLINEFSPLSNQFTKPQINKIERKKDELIPGLTLYLPNPLKNESENPICTINDSCQRCNIFIEFVDDGCMEIPKGRSLFTCVLLIKSLEIAIGEGGTKKAAKVDAATKGIATLMDKQTVIYKTDINHDHLKTVEKGALVKQAYETAPKLDDSNVGNKLLRKMGWKGSGGVGKHEHGIADPVFLQAAEGRKGVGTVGQRTIKRKTVEETLLEFIRNEEQAELRFSKELCNEERALIHRMCQRYGLKHKSHGKGEERYLVVSKKVI